MTYTAHSKPWHIEEEQEFLDFLLEASTRPRSELAVEAGFKEWMLRRALIACELYPEAHGGKYTGLKDKVRISLIPRGGHLVMVVTQKRLAPNKILEKKAEFDAIVVDDELMAQLRAAEASFKAERPSVFDLATRDSSAAPVAPRNGSFRPNIVGEPATDAPDVQ